MPFLDTYRGRRVLLTGDSGFKGSWLGVWLEALGAQVYGLSLAPEPASLGTVAPLEKRRNDDIRELGAVEAAFEHAQPDFVFHLAAQSLVRASYELPVETLATNVMGTAHLLEAVRRRGRPCTVVIVTTDKVYENREWEHGYREPDALGGKDLYSASKAGAELAAQSYRSSFFPPERLASHRVAIATARAGNVIGPGDRAKDRLMVDCVAALEAGQPIRVRNPVSVRPWQHVLEPLAGYLWLGARLARDGAPFCTAWNFGPHPEGARSVRDLVKTAIAAWGSGSSDESPEAGAPPEAGLLRLSIDRAVTRLGWFPVLSFEEAVKQTIDGYRALAASPGRARQVLENAISDYSRRAREAGAAWAQT